MDIKRNEQAAAAAPTMCVLPQPGGPYKRTLDLNLKGACAKILGNFEGKSTICHHNGRTKLLRTKMDTETLKNVSGRAISLQEIQNKCQYRESMIQIEN